MAAIGSSGGAAPIRVLIADEIAGAVDIIGKLADYGGEMEPCGVARSPQALVTEAERARPDVVLLNARLGGGIDVGTVADGIAAAAPGARLVLLPADGAARPSGRQVADAIRRAHAERAVALPPGSERPSRPVPRPRVERRTGRRGRVYIVFAGKGGVGKSMVASNVAAALAEAAPDRVAIVDLDLQFGDIGLMLGVEGQAGTIDELANRPPGAGIDAARLERLLTRGPAGLRVLAAPPSPELAELVSAETVRSVVAELARHHDATVVDAGTHLDDRTLEVMEMADAVVVVSALNTTAIKDTAATLRILRSLGIDPGKIVLVLNQTRARSSLAPEDVEERLARAPAVLLPYEPRIVEDAIDRGCPFAVGEPGSDIARRVRELASGLARLPSEEEPAGTGGVPPRRRTRLGRRRFAIGRRD